MDMGFTHFDENGKAVMVDVTEKDNTVPVSYTHLDVYKRQVPEDLRGTSADKYCRTLHFQ